MENKRKLSTVILIMFLAAVCYLCWSEISFIISETTGDATATLPESIGDGEENIILVYVAAAIAGAATGFVVLMLSGLIIIPSLICLGFSIRNTKNENKPVRVINIILSCCFASAAALGVTAIILMRVL